MLSGGVRRPWPTTRETPASVFVTLYACCVFCKNATFGPFVNRYVYVVSGTASPFLSM